jgi:putative transferase (TIGR04331 family)
VANASSPYTLYLQALPLADHWWDYIDDECTFIGALSEATRERLRFRPYSVDYGYGLRRRLEAFPSVRYDADRSMDEALRTAAIVVIDHFSTGFSETLAADVPTIAFWRPNRWEVRAEVEPIMARLRAASIVHDTPESAAAWTERVVVAPEEWWASAEVQDARLAFVERFALRADPWVDDWREFLTSEQAR